MLVGLPPFYDGASPSTSGITPLSRADSRDALGLSLHTEITDKMYEKILRDPLLFPDEVSPPARTILTGLLTRDPAQRLGVNGADEIKRHPFFDKIDWRRLAQKKIQPPFKPSVRSPVDVSNFDTVFTAEQPLDSVVEGSQLSQTVQAQFEGACFRPSFRYSVPVSRIWSRRGKKTRSNLRTLVVPFSCRLLIQRARNHRACGLTDQGSRPPYSTTTTYRIAIFSPLSSYGPGFVFFSALPRLDPEPLLVTYPPALPWLFNSPL
jgi:serine/threonine protein kinase